MDDIPLCPIWWPKIIWDLHWWPPHPGGPGGPVNMPAPMEDILSQLAMHTFTYKMLDQERAGEFRGLLESGISNTVQRLGAMHDEYVAKSK
jgi:hypothetical protein